MKNFLKKGAAIIVVAGLCACANEDKDQPTPQPNQSTVEFEQNLTISEATAEGYINVKLNNPASVASTLKIEVANPAGVPFTTVPATTNNQIELLIEKGASSKQITFKPSNDAVVNPERSIGFTLLSASNGLTLGTKQSISINITDDEQASTEPTTVNFQLSEGLIEENQTFAFKLLFSEATKTGGTIVLSSEQLISSQTVTTVPAMKIDGSLELPFQAGQTEVSFQLSVADDALVNRYDRIMFSLETLPQGFVQGDEPNIVIELIDNELKGLPQSFTSNGGGWTVRKTYEYNQQGKVSKVYREQSQGQGEPQRNILTYTYASNGLIEKVNEYPGIDEIFIQQNGRIIKSEKINHGELRSYKIYSYDQAGNVGGVAEYHKQSDGSFVQSMIHIYLYHNTGNLYAHLTYNPSPEGEEPTLIRERYYEHYLGVTNHFASAFEIIPGITAQPNLPCLFREVANGSEVKYDLRYDFNLDAKAIKRTGTSNTGASESVVYTYY